jgi:hypothetical protein
VASAYLYGRRHATLTALASVLLVVLLARVNPTLLADGPSLRPDERWVDITVWGGTLIITAYLIGTLYKHKDAQVRELRETYNGILLILRHFVSQDKYTENHSYRVSVYATKIGVEMQMDKERIEDIRSAAISSTRLRG